MSGRTFSSRLPANYSGRIIPAWDRKGALLLCLFVTPLILLAPFKLGKKNPPLTELLLYWKSQGQYQKPASIVAAEREIIQALFDIAKGSKSVMSIDKCLRNIEQIDFRDAADWRYTQHSPVSPTLATDFPGSQLYQNPRHSPSASGVAQAARRQGEGHHTWTEPGQHEASEVWATSKEDQMKEEAPEPSLPWTDTETDKDDMPVDVRRNDTQMLAEEE
ncbi:hypothetical protein H0H87_002333, partial [Tephrocybe sp. NHM501043]